MKGRNLAIILVVLVVLAVVIFAVTRKDGAEEAFSVLRVGSDVTYPPFEFVATGTNEYVGFDLDLIRAVAEEMGMRAEINNVSWDGIIPGLINKNYDVLISAMTILPERAEAINFSDPYLVIKQAIVVREDNTSIDGPEDLHGYKIGVQNGTTAHFELQKLGIKDENIVKFGTNAEAMLALSNGNVDVAVMDQPVAEYYRQEMKGLKIITDRGDDWPHEDYGIGVHKDNVELLQKVNEALASLKASGKYDEIYQKWFGSAE